MWPTIASIGGLNAIFDGGGDAYRQTVVAASVAKAQSGLAEGGIFVAVVTYVLFVFGMSSIFTGAVLWVARYRLLAVLPVILASAISVLTLQRTSVMLSVLLFVFGALAVKWSGVRVKQRANRAGRQPIVVRFATGVGALAVVGWFILFLSQSRTRTGASQSIIGTLGQYLIGGLSGLNARNVGGASWSLVPSPTGGFDPSPGMGGYTFSGLWSVLARIGIPVQQTRVNLNFIPVEQFGKMTMTNVASALGNYYLDFGWAGIILIPFAIALIVTMLQRRALSGSVLVVPAVAYLLAVGTWSFFGSWLSDVRLTLLALFGGWILKWALFRKGAAVREAPVSGTPVLSPKLTHR